MKFIHVRANILAILVISGLAFGCARQPDSTGPTPLPPGYLPTAVALTLQAGVEGQRTAARIPSPTVDVPTAAPLEPSPTSAQMPSISSPTATVATTTLPVTATNTPPPEFPDAAIQIYKPGDLSKVASPLHVSAYLKPGAEGKAWVELYGETGNLLVRQIRVFYTPPEAFVNLSLDLDFQIAATAEVGRVVISVKDEQGRITALNAVNLILLSIGESDINPASATFEAIDIQQPVSKAIIQGGTVLVSGMARPDTDQPLRVQLVTEDGKVVGQRLAKVSLPAGGGYGFFATEVAYSVDNLTPVLLTVFEDGENISEMVHLSSIGIFLSP